MKLKAWKFRVFDAMGNFKSEVPMEASRVIASGLRFEVTPVDTGRCTFQARPDGPQLQWGDLLEIWASADGTSYSRLYRGEARVVGIPNTRSAANYEIDSLKTRLAETEMPQMTLDSMDAAAQLRQVLQIIVASQVWGNAIYYDPSHIPDLGVNAPKLVATNYQLFSTYLDELSGYVNGLRTGLPPIVYGVNTDGYFTWGTAGRQNLDLRSRTDIIGVDWGSIVCDGPCTAVRWFLKPFPNLGAMTVLTKHPNAGRYGQRTLRQSLNILEAWKQDTLLIDSPRGAPYGWDGLATSDRQALQDGTGNVTVTFVPGANASYSPMLRPTALHPWSYFRATGQVLDEGCTVQIGILPYDNGQSVNMQAPALVAGLFDVFLPARTDLTLGGTGVMLNLNFSYPPGRTDPIRITFSRLGYYAPDQDMLNMMAYGYYHLPEPLAGQFEVNTLEYPPPSTLTLVDPQGALHTMNVTTEYLVSAGQYGHSVFKVGSPDPADQKALAALLMYRVKQATADALSAFS